MNLIFRVDFKTNIVYPNKELITQNKMKKKIIFRIQGEGYSSKWFGENE